nr:glycosyltransferase [Nesterenkonia sp. Act20]
MNKLFRILRRSAPPAQEGAVSEEPRPAESASRADDRTLFIGHTRFSVHQHGSGYFNATRGADLGAGFSEEEYTRWLYSETRLAPRTEIFTTLSLPQLAHAAKNHDVVHYVSYSPSLPEHHKAQLKAAAEEHSFLRLNETTKPVNSTPSRALVNQALGERDHGSRPFGVYRLDDDDLLSVRYFDQMAPYVTPRHIGWWVSLGTGFSAIRMDGKYAYTRELYYPKSAFGPMAIAAKNDDGEIANLSAPKHTVMDKFNPTILDSREPAYFHIRHESQDSTVKGSVAPFYPEAMNRIIGEGPADLDKVADLFPVLAGATSLEPGPASLGVDLSKGPISLSRAAVTFEWKHEGPIALLLDPADGERLQANQVQVRLTVAPQNSGGTVLEEGASKFFSQGRFRHSDRDGTYWTYMPQKASGFGHVLPIEPPKGVKVTGITLVTSRSESLGLDSVVAYPLPARRS